MKTSTYKAALRLQLRSPDAWKEQIRVIFRGIPRLIAYWMGATVTCIALAIFLGFLGADLSAYSPHQLKMVFESTAGFSAGAIALGCLLLNAGQFRNVFKTRAHATALEIEAATESLALHEMHLKASCCAMRWQHRAVNSPLEPVKIFRSNLWLRPSRVRMKFTAHDLRKYFRVFRGYPASL